MEVKYLTYAYLWPFGLGKNVRHLTCSDKLIELSDLIVLILINMSVRDAQYGLRSKLFEKYNFFCGKHTLLMAMIRVSDLEPRGLLLY